MSNWHQRQYGNPRGARKPGQIQATSGKIGIKRRFSGFGTSFAFKVSALVIPQEIAAFKQVAESVGLRDWQKET